MQGQLRPGLKAPGREESLVDIGKSESGAVTIPSPKQKFLLVKPFSPGSVERWGKRGNGVSDSYPEESSLPSLSGLPDLSQQLSLSLKPGPRALSFSV